MIKKLSPIILLSFLLVLCTCKKSDTANESGGVTIQGNVTLTVTITHHWWNVPSIPVYIKFGATEWPGRDSTAYDVRQVANLQGIVTFNHIGPGNLYLYAAGFDPIWQAYVIGYAPMNIDKADANTTVDTTLVVSEKF